MMMPILMTASTLTIPSHLSNAEKIGRIAPFFKPAPQSQLVLDALELKYQRSKNPKFLFGEIMVSPPKGSCIRIEKSTINRDESICESKAWRFSVGDLSDDGSLTLKIWIEGERSPILASWPSLYRKGRLRPYGLEAYEHSFPVTTRDCQIKIIDDRKRLVTVSFLGKLDDLEFILPPKGSDQTHAREMRNLLSVEATSPPIAKAKPTKKEAAPQPTSEMVNPPEKLNWDIKGKTYYSLPADRIITRTAPTPGMQGVCRYTDSGYGPQQDHGLIECHQTSDYEYLNVPLSCLKSGEAS